MEFNVADLFEAACDRIPDREILVCGERHVTFRELDRRANRMAHYFLSLGLGRGDHIAIYGENSIEWVEAMVACYKIRAVAININYRYVEDELRYLFDNADITTVVFQGDYTARLAAIRNDLPKLRHFIVYGANVDQARCELGAVEYEAALAGQSPERGFETRSGDDVYVLYTGGTTGMPKGVMWRHEDLRQTQLNAQRVLGPVPETLPELVEAMKTAGPGATFIPACPQMHGTGLLSSLNIIMSGGCVVTLDNQSFKPHELWEAVERHKVNSIAIVGDAFAKPMLKALDEAPGKYDLSSLIMIISSGVMWSTEVKRGLLAHMPNAIMTDSFGASEGVGFGSSLMTKDGEIKTAKFQIGPFCKVFDENDEPVEPGSGKPGIIAMGGPIPVGYYKDPEKTARTFRTIHGERYSIPGDWCVVETDGTLTLLGRGSVCINTAGEKVYPEEVEEALKTHPAVEDALVVGLPDEKWGQAVTGIVRINPGASFDEAELRAHVRERLAGYKTPKRIILGTIPFRAPNGKADYKSVTAFARQELGMA